MDIEKINYNRRNAILYLVKNLGSRCEGKKKIMKLMFLLDHYSFTSKNLEQQGALDNDFYIYHFGVFSMRVMSTVNTLIRERKIKDGYPLKIIDKSEIDLDTDLRKKIDMIIEEFGAKPGYKLEVETLKMLGVEPHEKGQYFGKDISSILKLTNASN